MNDRELATLIWAAVIIVWATSRADVRPLLIHAIRDALRPTIAVPFVAMTIYVSGLVLVASREGLWDSRLATDTIAWFVASGLGLFGASITVFRSGGSMRGLVRSALGLTLVVELFINLYVFSLPVELALIPVAGFLTAMSAFAATRKQYSAVKKLADRLLGAFGFAATVYVGLRLAREWNEFEQRLALRELLLPGWLTIGLVPYLAALGLWSNYSSAFAHIDWATHEGRRRRRARLALVSGLHLRARDVGAFNGFWCKELVSARSLTEARAVIRRFRQRDLRVPVPV